MTERTSNADGTVLLFSEVTIDGWETTLDLPVDAMIALYEAHGTNEQFHREFKTDLDLERLPSGKFDTNPLVLGLATVAYNILRLIGQPALLDQAAPLRHPVKRRRLMALNFGQHCPALVVWRALYDD